MDWLGETWDAITTAAPVPPASVVVGTAVAAVLVLAVPTLWHLTRHALTIVHEAGHAFVALLVGRRLSGIRLHSDTSGLTVSVGKPRGPGMVATVAAGYPAPALVGLGAAWLLSRGHALAMLWALLVLVVLVLLQIRNWYGLWAVLVSLLVLVGLTVWAPADVQAGAAYLFTWFFLLGAPRAVLEMQSQRRRVRVDSSDAGILGRLTHTPGLLWVGVLLVICLAALVVGGAWLVGLQLA